jgi:hypothetical protein
MFHFYPDESSVFLNRNKSQIIRLQHHKNAGIVEQKNQCSSYKDVIMKNDILRIRDPLGNQIHLPDHLGKLEVAKNAGDIYDDVTAVIRSPAMIIKINRGDGFELNYYRSVGWKMTLLIIAVFEENKWRAVQCIQNPDVALLKTLMSDGIIIQSLH